MSDPWKDVRFTNGRDRLKEEGPFTRLLACAFMAVVGAAAGLFLCLYFVGETRPTGSLAVAEAESVWRVFSIFMILGALGGIGSVIFWWPKKEPRDPFESAEKPPVGR